MYNYIYICTPIRYTRIHIYICMHTSIYTAYMYIYICIPIHAYTTWMHTNITCSHKHTTKYNIIDALLPSNTNMQIDLHKNSALPASTVEF